jgi:rhodanese-related sulfurtransferase
VPTPNAITPAQLSRLIGTADAPLVIDVRAEEDQSANPSALPTSIRREHCAAATWAKAYAGRSVAVVCTHGANLSQGVAAWLRHAGAQAEHLEGGFAAWSVAKGLLIQPAHVPQRNAEGRTVWVTRTRPKVDRIACRGSSAVSSIRMPSFCLSRRPK